MRGGSGGRMCWQVGDGCVVVAFGRGQLAVRLGQRWTGDAFKS